ncbi:DNA-directed RNA polymerase III subunit RPC5 [Hordeum vulgare]|nr:DNA-directed RNA polymerase III subunit RPC5 [Hordeum vulgare]
MDFTMSAQDYAMSLCPGAGGPAGSKRVNRFQVMEEMLSLPPEVRLKKWFTEVSQVNRFDALMHLAPASSEEDVLKILPAYADLVRGLWVCKSSLLYDDGRASKRDEILLQFLKGDSIPVKYVDRLIRDEQTRNMILNPLCKRREKLKDYKFIVPADSSFMKRYSHVVKEQENDWSSLKKWLTNDLLYLAILDSWCSGPVLMFLLAVVIFRQYEVVSLHK